MDTIAKIYFWLKKYLFSFVSLLLILVKVLKMALTLFFLNISLFPVFMAVCRCPLLTQIQKSSEDDFVISAFLLAETKIATDCLLYNFSKPNKMTLQTENFSWKYLSIYFENQKFEPQNYNFLNMKWTRSIYINYIHVSIYMKNILVKQRYQKRNNWTKTKNRNKKSVENKQ